LWEIEETNTESNTTVERAQPTNGETVSNEIISSEKSQDNKSERVNYSQKLVQENDLLKQQRLCKVCLDEEAAIVFLPCGHLVACGFCASALHKCPVCRRRINGTVRAIFS